MGEILDAPTRPQPSGRLFTIGIPVFNGKSLLRNCLQSVINSTLPRDRFEIIIADDGSSEPETLAILGDFEKNLAADPGFYRVISSATNSGGAARPRNRILDHATGDYVFFVDSDDTIGNLALERIAETLTVTPFDWVALNQVPVNGRGALCVVRQPYAEVPRVKALSTLTVHKVFRRAEIERQQLRFDEGLPSGQDVSFSFSYIVNAARFVKLGGYDYYYLTQHANNPNEPAHLSKRANTPATRIEKNERILGSMLTALRKSDLPESERREIVSDVVLPRVLIGQGQLKAIVRAGPKIGTRALRRLSELLDDPLVADLDPAELKRLTPRHLEVIAKADWVGLAITLLSPHPPIPPSPLPDRPPAAAAKRSRGGVAERWVTRGLRFVDVASGRARHRRVVNELAQLRGSVDEIRDAQRRLEAKLQAEFSRPGADSAGGS